MSIKIFILKITQDLFTFFILNMVFIPKQELLGNKICLKDRLWGCVTLFRDIEEVRKTPFIGHYFLPMVLPNEPALMLTHCIKILNLKPTID